MHRIPERDWRRLSELKPLALDRLCHRILEDLRQAAAGPQAGSHERYLTVYRLIDDRNAEIARAFDRLSRSSAILKLREMRRAGVITDEEFAGFSEETRNAASEIW